ncbi:MAG TPA: PQQ-dependent sugar dehydrogenase [bacterium]|nr:PQQ-dependent sugar dehydrogenase [bacterium]
MKNNTSGRTYYILSGLIFGTFILVLAITGQETHPGAEDYYQYCATCHGKDLKGGNGSSLIDGEWEFIDGPAEMAGIIKNGLPENGMPGFAAMLSDEQVNQMIEFIGQAEGGAESAAPAPESLRTLDYKINAEVFVHGLEIPWAIDFIDETTALVTERPGGLRVVESGRLLPDPVAGTPEVLHAGQGGLMDVAIDPDYKTNGWVYLSYSHALRSEGGGRAPAMTRIVRGRIRDNTWVDQQVLFEAPHDMYRTTRHHYGSRIVFDKDGYLYFSIGDRGGRQHAQDLSRPNGKVHRIHRDGSIPEDNPFVNVEGAMPSVFTYGHRNPQGLAVHPVTGRIWDAEHAPRGGDELNLLTPGYNYGWPDITYGINYNGTVLTPDRHKEGMEQPNLYWRPSIAVCGTDFYDGDLFSYWKNYLLVSALAYEEVRLLNIVGDRVIHQEVILKDAGRVREAVAGPDGAIYVVLNDPHMILRLTLENGWQPI